MVSTTIHNFFFSFDKSDTVVKEIPSFIKLVIVINIINRTLSVGKLVIKIFILKLDESNITKHEY